MMSMLHDLSGSLAVLAVCALAIGFAFEKIDAGMWRDCAVGLAGSLAAVTAFALTGFSEPVLVTAGSAAMIVVGLFAGPLAAAVALVLPLALRIEVGGGGTLTVGLTLIVAALLGVGAAAILRRRGHTVDRHCVLVVAGLSPLLLLPSLGVLSQQAASLFAPLALWLAFSTAVFGLLVLSERRRTQALRKDRQENALLRETRQVSSEIFDTQVNHHWHLHDRYGAQFGYMIATIDDGAALRRSLTPAAWHGVRAQVGRLIREAVRDGDICGPVNGGRIGILLPYIGSAAMGRVAARIRDGVADARIVCGAPVSVSIGMAHVDEANGPDDLRILAESALVVARATTPRGAIGPQGPDGEETGLVRSFPGILMPSSPAARPAFPPPAELRDGPHKAAA